MKNGWTGGQYTIFRVVFGLYLFVHFAQLAPWSAEVFSSGGILPTASASPILGFFPNLLAICDSPAFVTWFTAVGAGLSLLFAAGIHDRWAAVGAWYLWACLLGRNPLISNPSIPYVGWLLLAHACLPRAGFGDWVGRGRTSGDVPWRMAPSFFAAAWILMALGYSYSGWTKLMSPSWQDGTALLDMVANPLGRHGPVHALLLGLPAIVFKLAAWGALSLELFFAPLSLIRRLRPWLWSLLVAMHLLLILMIDFADLSLGMVMLHLFTFDPAWIRPRGRGAPGTIFYDGRCAFCHGFVRFVLSEEPAGETFRFSPLATGETIVVRTGDGLQLTRSDAVLVILGRLGGMWRLAAVVAKLVPRVLRDGLYGLFARVRRRLFATPDQACPILPPRLRARFQDL
jgi:predicted DCC family thiol-disulfide oxidoreductase YuxK